MNEALIQHEMEGQNSTANKVDILDYLSFANSQVIVYIWITIKLSSYNLITSIARKFKHCVRINKTNTFNW